MDLNAAAPVSFHRYTGQENDAQRREIIADPPDILLTNYVMLEIVYHFDHRFATYEGQTKAQPKQGKCPELSDADHETAGKLALPYYWLSEQEVSARLEGWDLLWLFGWPQICRTSDIRTLICSLLPAAACGDSLFLMLPSPDARSKMLPLAANLSSFVTDYVARQKVGGTNFSYYIIKKLSIAPPDAYEQLSPWSCDHTLSKWFAPRIIELAYTANDLAGGATVGGRDGALFRWDVNRRAAIRAELDASFLHLYGIDRTDADYILDTFPVVRDKETREHGEYRTKRLVLERYDVLSAAIASGTPYVSPLSPPPADLLGTHSPDRQDGVDRRPRGS